MLESLCVQSVDRRDFEVIVVDDGSTDDTRSTVESFSPRLQIRYEHQRNAGIASARNHALFLARGRIVLFQDDDDIASPYLLAEHLRTHEAWPADHFAVLGYTNLTPALTQDPLMHYVTEVGHWLYSYPTIEDGQQLDFSYLWGGRSSCKRKLLLEHGVFNPIFRFGCEDIELAWRLRRSGLRVVYNARAVSTTVRAISFDAFCDRLMRQGRSSWIFNRMHRDTEVQRWTEVDLVPEWDSLAGRYERIRTSTRKADVVIRAKRELKLSIDFDRAPLHDAYLAAFRASKIKGMAEQALEEAGAAAPHVRSALLARNRRVG
jgi:GT2 family glycosyltransferase